VYEKPLQDNCSAVMVLNRGETPLVVEIQLEDLADSTQAVYGVLPSLAVNAP
jgi:hypothetical protein